jgi:hypothetical protein
MAGRAGELHFVLHVILQKESFYFSLVGYVVNKFLRRGETDGICYVINVVGGENSRAIERGGDIKNSYFVKLQGLTATSFRVHFRN